MSRCAPPESHAHAELGDALRVAAGDGREALLLTRVGLFSSRYRTETHEPALGGRVSGLCVWPKHAVLCVVSLFEAFSCRAERQTVSAGSGRA